MKGQAKEIEQPVLVYESKPNEKYKRPRDIDTNGVSLRGFGKFEVEETALMLVKFFQKRNLWHQFRPEDFLRFCDKNNYKWGLFGLLGAWWDDAMLVGGVRVNLDPYLVYLPFGDLCVTERFVGLVSDPKAPGGRL